MPYLKGGDMEFLLYFYERREVVLLSTLRHIQVSVIAVFLSIVIAIPLGILVTRYRKMAHLVVNSANVGQTIPSLAILGMVIPVLGIGLKPAVFALVLRGVLPIINNTYSGIVNVDRSVIEAGRGMGMRNREILRLVELPLSFPVIMAGIRTATVLSISVATLAALIGAGGLGDLIFQGIVMADRNLLLVGSIPTAILAIGADLLLGWLERRLRKGSAQ
jgi:osmoprotectant transport system permease protein